MVFWMTKYRFLNKPGALPPKTPRVFRFRFLKGMLAWITKMKRAAIDRPTSLFKPSCGTQVALPALAYPPQEEKLKQMLQA
jgi:hypothetical protein